MDERNAQWHLSQETRVVTKKEIVKAISEEIGLTQLKTKEIVQKTFDAIVDTLVREERIELRNFGVFEVKKRAARKARNPRTGDPVEVEAKYVVTFKPGKEMEERVKELEERDAREAALKAEQSPKSESPKSEPSPKSESQKPEPSAQGDGQTPPSSQPPAEEPPSSEDKSSSNSQFPSPHPSTQYST
jgi:integration host factor subunit beta